MDNLAEALQLALVVQTVLGPELLWGSRGPAFPGEEGHCSFLDKVLQPHNSSGKWQWDWLEIWGKQMALETYQDAELALLGEQV